MNARELLEAGRLTAAIEALNGELKARPNDLPGRTILFDLLCYAGDLTRAERQLDVIGHQGGGAEAAIGVRFYQNLLAAEKARTRLFAEGVRPRFLLEPPPAVSQHLEALDRIREGRADEARALLDRAAASRTPIRGTRRGGRLRRFPRRRRPAGPRPRGLHGDRLFLGPLGADPVPGGPRAPDPARPALDAGEALHVRRADWAR